MIKLGRIALLAFAAVLLHAGAASAQEKVTLRLDWTWWAGQAPFMVAAEKGFYKEAGLDVTWAEGQGSKTTTILVGENRENFGYVSLSTAAQSISSGVPIKAIAAFWQRGSLGLTCLEKSNIKAPRDVIGKTIGSTPTGSDAQVLPAFLGANQIEATKVTVVGMPGEAKVGALAGGRVDCISGDNFLYAKRLAAENIKTTEIIYADAGVTNLSYGLITSDKMIKEKPDTVKRFIAASLKGFDYAFAHEDEAIKIFKAKTQNQQPDSDLKYVLDYYKNQTHTKTTQGKAFGWMSTEDWDTMNKDLEKFGDMKGRKANDAYFTDDFLPNPKG